MGSVVGKATTQRHCFIFISVSNKMKLEQCFKWGKFLCPKSSLRLDITLKCGQSFRWKVWQSQSFSLDTPVYIGVLQGRLLLLTQDESHVFYHCVNDNTNEGIEE